MNDERVELLTEFGAPYGRSVRLEQVEYESGLCMLRVRIREGRRFTVMDLDRETASLWAAAMSSWAGGPRTRA
jgi:hypothetical protein